ncbi:MAG: hypothetical protein DRJ49_01470 [Thermoprotei archaeon]|nr:MAG: hypothetical protein DRJ49_01470 [Thermoprotei archaeon]
MDSGGEYKSLLKSLVDFVRKKKEISSEELLKWANEHDVGVITLQVLIEDLKSKGSIEVSSEEREISCLLGRITIPSSIKIKRVYEEVKRSRPKPKVRKKERGMSILDFIESEEPSVEEEKVSPIKEREEERTPELKLALGRETISKFTEERKAIREHDEIDLAINYLNRYPSVGSIRFAIDLKGMGVSDPEALMRKLIDLGYIVIDDLGVVNITDKLPKVDRESVKLSNLVM